MQVQLKELDSSHISLIQILADEASSEGFRFVQRTVDEWKNGINTFSKPGESLIGIFLAEKCIGIVLNSQIGLGLKSEGRRNTEVLDGIEGKF